MFVFILMLLLDAFVVGEVEKHDVGWLQQG